MLKLSDKKMSTVVDFEKGCMHSLLINGKEVLNKPSALFRIRLLNRSGERTVFDTYNCVGKDIKEQKATYRFSFEFGQLEVQVCVKNNNNGLTWNCDIVNSTDCCIEWVDFPSVELKPLIDDGGTASIVFPYNEGALVKSAKFREYETGLRHYEIDYPSEGCYAVFPNMLSSQFISYLTEGYGLYIGAHDEDCGIKSLDFYPVDEGVRIRIKSFTGLQYGEDYKGYDIRWEVFEGDWYDSAELYRQWIEKTTLKNTKKLSEREDLPKWYNENLVVVAYPVRGVHDTDEMKPSIF